jgi:hypothetical protein
VRALQMFYLAGLAAGSILSRTADLQVGIFDKLWNILSTMFWPTQ